MYTINQANSGIIIADTDTRSGFATQPASGSITVKQEQFGPFNQVVLTLNEVPQAVVNGTEFQGTKIWTFPEGRIFVKGCVASLQQKTTSVLASTLNASSTGAISLGTATASNVALTGTMVDLLPSTAFVSSATVNVAGTAVTAVLAAAAAFDGTSTAKSMFLNTAYATTTDVDADATQTISGTITITYDWLGDF